MTESQNRKMQNATKIPSKQRKGYHLIMLKYIRIESSRRQNIILILKALNGPEAIFAFKIYLLTF